MLRAAEISKVERRAILAFVLLPVFLFSIYFAEDAIRSYNYAVADAQRTLLAQSNNAPLISFSACGRGDFFPGFQLLWIFIPLALIRPTRFIVATAITGLFVALQITAIAITIHLGSEAGLGDPQYIVHWYSTQVWSIWNVLGVIFSFPLLAWLASIVWRLHHPSMIYE